MKKITTNIIKKVLGGGSAKQLYAINGLLDLQIPNLEKEIKDEIIFLNEKEKQEIEKIKAKFSEKKSELEDVIISKAIKEIASKNKIVIEKKSEPIVEKKIEEVEIKVEPKIEAEELSEADRIMEELVFENPSHGFQNSWNQN